MYIKYKIYCKKKQYLYHFIAKYKNLTYLWNVRRKDYCNQKKNKSAYDDL